ncbi:MAG: histidinol-phosphatase HisJ family protein [Eubacteriales bacterium]|nr:histidinol-phosphatase HisJ family protein [Eubacteriales bacterium]
MLYSSPHTHTIYVDGKSTPREMVEAALAKGFVSFGFSEHAEDERFGLTKEGERAYFAEAQALKAEYADRLRIWIGIERDSISHFSREGYDYVIGSVHYVPWGEGYASVDGSPEKLAQCIAEEYHGDAMAYLQAYYDRLAGYVSEYRPEIIGHFDLVRKWNGRLGLFDPADPAYRRLVCGALERMIGSGALLEVNTGAIARGYMDDPYPDAFSLAYWRRLGGKAIVGSDCHLAANLDCGYDKARRRLLEAGYESVVLLGDGERLFMECPV